MAKTALTTTNTSISALTIKLFNSAVPDNAKTDFAGVNKEAVKLGYLVHSALCNAVILDYLKSQAVDYSSTFYKKWSSVISKSRFELFEDQLMHYASTYGTNFTGEPYIPTEIADVPAFTTFKVISPITKSDLIVRCEKMLCSGIALKQETIEDILTILNWLNHRTDINKVKNKEAKMFLHKTTATLPKEAVELVRFLVYLCTDKTLLIKDKATIGKIKLSGLDVSTFIIVFGVEDLASVFYRFKPLFLAFKSANKSNIKIINKLRKLAVKFHEPMEVGFFESLLTNQRPLSDVNKELLKITNFKKILLLQTINIRLKELEINAYLVRNQKLYIKVQKNTHNESYLKSVYWLIYNDLVKSLSKKACSVTLPKGVNLTLPTSEKSFIGNYPLGTSFDLADQDAIVGINWKGKDGARDLDLSLMSIDGQKYGWDSAYKNANSSIVYSGDMTSAEPEATELFYTSNNFGPCIVKVNLYYGQPNSKFKFFLAKEKIINISRNYMVDPNNVLVMVDCEMDSKEKSLGVITNNKFILAQFRTGKGRVSTNNVTDLYTEYALSTLDCYLPLDILLLDAGFDIVQENADIDLTNLSKDSLMNLLN